MSDRQMPDGAASERLARLYAALSATNEAILRAHSSELLYQGVCDAAVYAGKFISASMLIPDPTTHWIELVAGTGEPKEMLRRVRASTDERVPEGRGIVATAYRNRATCVCNDVPNDPRTRPWHEGARRVGVVSGAAVPVLRGGNVVGILLFNSTEKNDFDAETVWLLERLAQNMAFALDNLEREDSRREAERRLRESEEKYRAIIEGIEDAYYEVDVAGNLVFCNSAFPRLLGYTVEEMIGCNNRDVQNDAMAAVVYRAFNDVYRSGVAKRSQEWEWIHKNGDHVRVEGSVHLVRNVRGEAVGFRGILRDVTARRQMEERLRESEEKYRSILENIEDAYYEVDTRGNLVFFNGAFSRMLGYLPEELMGINNRVFQAPDVAKETYTIFNQVYRTGSPAHEHAWRMTRKDGTCVWVEGSVQLVKDAGGHSIGFRGMLRDITARREMEQRLRESEARFRALTELSSDWYWEQDAEFRFTRVESRHGTQDWVRTALLGKRAWEIGFHVETDGGWNAQRAALEAHQPFRDVVMRTRRKNGRRHYISVSGEPVFGEDGKFRGYRGVTREITKQKLAEERVQYLATHDALTGLPNRVMFSQLLNNAINTAHGHGHKCAVLFLDLDRFKVINDTLGHEAGDFLLKEMAERLQTCLRSGDVVARLGGDEFVVLLPKVAGSPEIAGVARKLLSASMRPIAVYGQECRVTASVGICVYPRDGTDEHALMKHADVAMYLAKEEGKNNFQFYSRRIKTQSLERLALEAGLRRALDGNEFTLTYQPKLSFRTGSITAVEALIRWHHPQLGSVSPTQFIPLAEETGLIVAIGRWVLRTACLQSVAWQRAGLPTVRLAVNLSARQFADTDLLDDIRGALAHADLRPELLELEITEGMVTQNAERAVRLLDAIKSMGVRLAIDDFGTGYSSLAQLKRFPIDTLKIDRSFIREIPYDAEDNAITEAIIAMAKTLRLTVVAEGVETEEQVQFLRAHGCDEMQGYYFGQPMGADEFAEFLRVQTAHMKLAGPATSG